MPRTALGAMSVLNTFTPGTTISSAQVNATLADIAAELTKTFNRDGGLPMTGPLPLGANYVEANGMSKPSTPVAGRGRSYWRTVGGVARPFALLSDGSEYEQINYVATPQQFGAIPGINSPTQAAANAAAFAAAMAASSSVYIPAGDWYTETINVPTTCKRIFGEGRLIAAGTPTPALVLLQNNPGCVLEGFSVEINIVTFPGVDGIRLNNCQSCIVRRVRAQGSAGIVGVNCQRSIVTGCVIDSYSVIGISFDFPSRVQINNNFVSGGAVGSLHGIATRSGTEINISDNMVVGAKIFSVSVSGLSGDAPAMWATIIGNVSLDSLKEGISVGNLQHFTIANNLVFFANGVSQDFGISVAGDVTFVPPSGALFGIVTGNVVFNCSKEGIALTDGVQEVTVTGNFIRSPCQTEVGPAILITGSRSTGNCIINNHILDFTGNVSHQVAEEIIGGLGTPNDNILGPNYGHTGTGTQYSVLGSNSEPKWKEFTPAVTPEGGAFGTVSAAGRYRVEGKTVHFNILVTVTAAGTATGYVQATLPFTALIGVDSAAAGLNHTNAIAIAGHIIGNTNLIRIRKYDATTAIASGAQLRVAGSYEMIAS